MPIEITSSGSFDNTIGWLDKLLHGDIFRSLDRYGELGVAALAAGTPVRSGLTADSWAYRVGETNTGYAIEWYNTHVVEGVNIAIILQYGHGTGTGGYVSGIDYINPALQPVFDEIAADLGRELA